MPTKHEYPKILAELHKEISCKFSERLQWENGKEAELSSSVYTDTLKQFGNNT